jgi:hypothetical protein
MIRIYGCSDDLVEIDTDDDSSDEIETHRHVSILVGTKEGGCIVTAKYGGMERLAIDGFGGGGTWRLSVDMINEGIPIPWGISIAVAECQYSPTVMIDCPSGTPWRDVSSAKKKSNG